MRRPIELPDFEKGPTMENLEPARVSAENHDTRVDNGTQSASVEKVFHLASSGAPLKREGTGARDWAAAIDLVKEATEAIATAQKRADDAEEYSEKLATYHKEQIRSAEARIAAAEHRTEAALKRATDAEQWLMKFHDAITSGFGRLASNNG